jgi:hypothetical protein
MDHAVDGVARRGGEVELVEVELTPKALPRYVQIFSSHVYRMVHEGAGRVVYFCDPKSERAVRREADVRVFRDDRDRVVTLSVFDARGNWCVDDGRVWVGGRPGPATGGPAGGVAGAPAGGSGW